MRRHFGIRVSSKDYTICILEGSKPDVKLVKIFTNKAPANCSDAERLLWFYKEFTAFIKTEQPAYVVIKADESPTRKASAVARARNEGTLLLALATSGSLKSYAERRNVTLAKAIFGKGEAKYTKGTKVPGIENIEDYNTLQRDAILCALSEVK